MTRTTNARIAGFTYFFYFAAGVASMFLAGQRDATNVVSMLTSFSALVLGVTLYALTRNVDADLAMLGLLCRVIEAVPGEGAIYFAVGTTLFAWLFLRGRLIPSALAWLGVIASALLIVIITMQSAGLFGGPGSWSSPVTWFMWLPALVFELTLAVWLLVKGVAEPSLSQSAQIATTGLVR